MVSLANFIEHMGKSATLKHITGEDYDDDYDEATPVFSSSSVYALMQPLTGEDLKQLTGGIVDKATLKAFLSPDISIGENDRLTVGRETWRVEQVVARRDEYIKAVLSQLTLPSDYAKIAIISDVHWGQTDGEYVAACASLTTDIGTDYDEIVFLGDAWETYADDLPAWHAALASLAARHKIYVWGNHDYNSDTYSAAYTALEGYGYDPSHPRLLEIGDTTLIFINTFDGTITETELSGLSDRLDAVASTQTVYVFGHIPVIVATGHDSMRLDNYEQLTYLLSKHSVAVYIAGHDHNVVGEYDDDVPQVGTQTTYEAEDSRSGGGIVIADTDAYEDSCVYHPADGTDGELFYVIAGTSFAAGDYILRLRLKSASDETANMQVMVYDHTISDYLLGWTTVGTVDSWRWTLFYPFTVAANEHTISFKVKTIKASTGVYKYADRLEIYEASTGTLKQLYSRRADGSWGTDSGFAVLDVAPSGTTFWTQLFGDDTVLNEVEL